jgi:hypothetical protein
LQKHKGVKYKVKTVNDLILHCQTALKEKWQYVYGAKKQKLSLQQIKQLQKQYGSMVWQSDLLKAGQTGCDCSGLISSCTGIERSSTNYKQTALETISLNELKNNWEKYIGYGLWMQGHIGVVSETKGYYYAMDGSARNMVKYLMSMQNWTCAIKLKDIDYSGGYVDMDKYNELKQEIDSIFKEISNIKPKVYNTIEEIPEWGKEAVTYYLNNNLLQGTDKGLNISYDLLRLLVILYREKSSH